MGSSRKIRAGVALWVLRFGSSYDYGQNVTCEGDLEYTDCGTMCEKICGEEEPGFCAFVCVPGCQCPSSSPWRHDATSNSCYASSDACPTATVLGADADDHGCIASAGYAWCAATGTCERACGTVAPTALAAGGASPMLTGGDADDHGCLASAGYSWCQGLGDCVRAWETPCVAEATYAPTPGARGGTVVGRNEDEEHGCLASAGYSWCAASGACVGPADACGEALVEEGTLVGGDRDEHDCCASCGYTWCESSQSCVRLWETGCEAAASTGGGGGGDDDKDEVAGAMTGVALVVLVLLLLGIGGGLFAVKHNKHACQSPEKEMLVVDAPKAPGLDVQVGDAIKDTDIAVIAEDGALGVEVV